MSGERKWWNGGWKSVQAGSVRNGGQESDSQGNEEVSSLPDGGGGKSRREEGWPSGILL